MQTQTAKTINPQKPKKKYADPKKLTGSQKAYLALVAGFILGPFLPLIIQSFAFKWAWPNLTPTRWWWEQRDNALFPLAWDYVFSPASRIFDATVNTVFIGICVTLICLVIALPAARVLAREKFKGKSLFEFFLSMPLIVPETAIALGLLMIFIRLDLAGTYWAIIIVHLIPTLPYMIRMLTSVYQGLGLTYEEQAAILGATPWQILTRVTLPMLMPGILAGALLAFLVSTNIFLLTFFMGLGNIYTLPTLLFAKISGGQIDGSTAGIALLVTLPGIVLLLLSERFIKEEAFGAGTH